MQEKNLFYILRENSYRYLNCVIEFCKDKLLLNIFSLLNLIVLILGKDKMVLVVGARGPGHGWRPQ